METEREGVELNDGEKGGHDERLMEMLRELSGKLGSRGVARLLDTDRRTVRASLDSGELTRRMRVALERLLLERAEAEAAQERERIVAIVQGMEALTEEVRAVSSDVAALQQKHEQAIRVLSGRLSRLEERVTAAQHERVEEKRVNANGTDTPHSVGRKPPRREHPDIVTREPAPDDEEVYGEAWPLVDEWRRLWARHPQRGKGLAWLIDDERILELEVAMLREHLLTLPPETQPVGGHRRSHLQWREAALLRVRRERAEAERLRWLRRVLTLGLWWE